jgi:hypothetical protein
MSELGDHKSGDHNSEDQNSDGLDDSDQPNGHQPDLKVVAGRIFRNLMILSRPDVQYRTVLTAGVPVHGETRRRRIADGESVASVLNTFADSLSINQGDLKSRSFSFPIKVFRGPQPSPDNAHPIPDTMVATGRMSVSDEFDGSSSLRTAKFRLEPTNWTQPALALHEARALLDNLKVAYSEVAADIKEVITNEPSLLCVLAATHELIVEIKSPIAVHARAENFRGPRGVTFQELERSRIAPTSYDQTQWNSEFGYRTWAMAVRAGVEQAAKDQNPVALANLIQRAAERFDAEPGQLGKVQVTAYLD